MFPFTNFFSQCTEAKSACIADKLHYIYHLPLPHFLLTINLARADKIIIHLLCFRVTGVYLSKAKMQKFSLNKGWQEYVYNNSPPTSNDTENILQGSCNP